MFKENAQTTLLMTLRDIHTTPLVVEAKGVVSVEFKGGDAHFKPFIALIRAETSGNTYRIRDFEDICKSNI